MLVLYDAQGFGCTEWEEHGKVYLFHLSGSRSLSVALQSHGFDLLYRAALEWRAG